jgi:sugar porter (SP) family MFS transporter
MFASGTIPAVLFAALLVRIPESPRWLIENQEECRARLILAKVAGSAFADAELQTIKAAIGLERGSWRELFSPALRLPILIGAALAVLQQVTGINVFMYFGATIFRNLSSSTGLDAGLLQQIVINGSGVLFTVVAIASVDRWGRKPLMLVGTAGMGLSLIAMGLLAQYASDPAAHTTAMLLFILLYIACFGLSVGPVTWVILAEIFPTAVRGRALGLVTFFLWLADYAVTQTFPMLDAKNSWCVRQFHHALPFYVYAAFCLGLIFVVRVWVPETKNRSLEDIERAWSR